MITLELMPDFSGIESGYEVGPSRNQQWTWDGCRWISTPLIEPIHDALPDDTE